MFLSECLAESVSRPSFSLNLVTKFFTEEVRLTSNVSGRDKNQLDKDMIAAIKVASFTMWPLKSSENEVKAWRDCVKAIDEGGRCLRRRVAKLNESGVRRYHKGKPVNFSLAIDSFVKSDYYSVMGYTF